MDDLSRSLIDALGDALAVVNADLAVVEWNAAMERLTGLTIATVDDAKAAAAKIMGFGCRAVLLKGGHLSDAPATDVLYDGTTWTVLPGEWIDTKHTHGTGCTYSAAIAARLARGASLVDAVGAAKRYVTEAIRHSLAIGRGCGPTHHFYHLPDPLGDA